MPASWSLPGCLTAKHFLLQLSWGDPRVSGLICYSYPVSKGPRMPLHTPQNPFSALGPFWIQGLESTFLSKLADLIWNLKRLYYVLGSQTLLQLAPEVLPWGLDHLIQGLLLRFSPGLYPWASSRSKRVQTHLLLHLRVSIRLLSPDLKASSQLSWVLF